MDQLTKYSLKNGKELLEEPELFRKLANRFGVLTITRLQEESPNEWIVESTIFQPPCIEQPSICPLSEYLFFDLDLLGQPETEALFNNRETDHYRFRIGRKELYHLEAMNDMIRTYQNNQKDRLGEQLVANLLSNSILFLKTASDRSNGTEILPAEVEAPIGYSRIAKEFRELISLNFRKDKKVDCYSKRLNISSRTLSNIVKRIYMKSPKEMIDEFLIEMSKKMIEDRSLSIKYIAYELGFGSANNFSMFFKKHLKETPSSYRSKFCDEIYRELVASDTGQFSY